MDNKKIKEIEYFYIESKAYLFVIIYRNYKRYPFIKLLCFLLNIGRKQIRKELNKYIFLYNY